MSGWDLLLVVLRKLSKLNYFQLLHPIFDFIFLFGYFIHVTNILSIISNPRCNLFDVHSCFLP